MIRGDATDEEVAAIVATLSAVAAATASATAATARQAADEAEAARGVRRNWNDRTRLMRAPVHPSPGGWARPAF